MSLCITSLNSGSNGNCYYVGNHTEAVLIDAGISCRETEKRLTRLGLSISNVKAVFISHEHTDHIRGIQAIASRHRIPIYITAATLHHSRMSISGELVKAFLPGEPISIGELTINAFSKHHDAIDPYSFTVEGNGITIGVFTDIGTPCHNLISSFKRCHAAFLEANYDETMLEEGGYPIHLKRRIRGGKGHLSNREALELFTAHRPAFMSHLLLAHLSKNNNCPELVSELFRPFSAEVTIVVASRYNETEVYQISGQKQKPLRTQNTARPATLVQASLF
jgi:phosphoribosyl 1,2-cyclic phosphodiesterase